MSFFNFMLMMLFIEKLHGKCDYISTLTIIITIQRFMKNTIRITGNNSCISILADLIGILGIERFVLLHQANILYQLVGDDYQPASKYVQGEGLLSWSKVSESELVISYFTKSEFTTAALGISRGLSFANPSLSVEHLAWCEKRYIHSGYKYVIGKLIDHFLVEGKNDLCNKLNAYIFHLGNKRMESKGMLPIIDTPNGFRFIQKKTIESGGFDYIDETYEVEFTGKKLYLLLSYDYYYEFLDGKPYIISEEKVYELTNLHWSDKENGLCCALSEHEGALTVSDFISFVPNEFMYKKV